MVNFALFLFAGANGTIIITLMSRGLVTAVGQWKSYHKGGGSDKNKSRPTIGSMMKS
jgi:hypothetical protein